VKRSISRLGNSVKSMESAGPAWTDIGEQSNSWASPEAPVHTVGAEALESEIAAEDFGDALGW
jgi:hypothetical protein